MLISRSFIFAFLAALPSVQAIKKDYWIALDCYVGDVTVDGKFVDADRSLKYDWQLTAQTCKNNFGNVANYDMGSGRCVAITPDGINGPQWWNNCKIQARNGWYDLDSVTLEIVQDQSPYKSNNAEGRGYPA
ncbi:hypothetical protein CI238_09715 [Colletotrichum incanum]|uniref:Uncharacterized protein n=1 Tax=Colletotrichum incanum TaxID=1573173 RepID=A0A167EF57_COLIC|nr:hypothetical protein CI238_09715 [Colletotrichum incanum]